MTIYGGPFFRNNIAFLSCAFGDIRQPVVTVEDTFVQCYTPNSTRNTVGTVELRVLLNNADYTGRSLNFSFFGCNPTSISQCGDSCMSQTGCGWCVGDQTCVGEARCSSKGIFLDSCLSLSVMPTFVTLNGTEPITVSFNRPLEILDKLQPNTTQSRRSVFQSTIDSPFYCQFGTASVPAYALTGSNSSITCTPPSVAVDGIVPLTIIYRGTILAGPIDFQYLGTVQLNRFIYYQCLIVRQQIAVSRGIVTDVNRRTCVTGVSLTTSAHQPINVPLTVGVLVNVLTRA